MLCVLCSVDNLQSSLIRSFANLILILIPSYYVIRQVGCPPSLEPISDVCTVLYPLCLAQCPTAAEL